MKHYLYRIKKEDYGNMKDVSMIEIDYAPIEIGEKDKIIVFISESLQILGEYRKQGEVLALQNKIEGKTLKDFYGKLSIAEKIGERTYKVFAKKVKEIEKEDYEKILR